MNNPVVQSTRAERLMKAAVNRLHEVATNDDTEVAEPYAWQAYVTSEKLARLIEATAITDEEKKRFRLREFFESTSQDDLPLQLQSRDPTMLTDHVNDIIGQMKLSFIHRSDHIASLSGIAFTAPTRDENQQATNDPTASPLIFNGNNLETHIELLQTTLVGAMDKRFGRIEKLLRGPELRNFAGYLGVELYYGNRSITHRTDEGRFVVCPDHRYEFSVWLAPDNPKLPISDRINIRGGVDASVVDFEVYFDSDTIYFDQPREILSARPGVVSDRLTFTWTAPHACGQYLVWIQVYQGRRLLLSLPIELAIRQ